MKTRGLTVLAIAALMMVALVLPATVQAEATTYTSVTVVPVTIGFNEQCNGIGLIEMSGEMHVLMHTTLDGNGGTHVEIQHKFVNVTDPSGRWRAIEVTGGQENTNVTGLPTEYTTVLNFRVIGPGPDNNYFVRTIAHVTINANGEITADVDNLFLDICH